LAELVQLIWNSLLGGADSSKESFIGGQEIGTLAGIQIDQRIQQLIEFIEYFVRMSDPLFG